MKTISQIFADFYNKSLKKLDKGGQIEKFVTNGNYQYVLGFALAKKVDFSKDVRDAELYLNFKLLRSRQIGSAGENLFKADYEAVAGKDALKKLERGNQDQLNPDFFEIKKKKYIEVKTATIYQGNKFIFEQIRLKDPRINYYLFLGITPIGRFYWVLNKNDIKAGKQIFEAKFSPQHSTSGSNATYQWHPAYEQMKDYTVKPEDLSSIIV